MFRQKQLSVILAIFVAALVIETCEAQGFTCPDGTGPDPGAGPPSSDFDCYACNFANCADCSTDYQPTDSGCGACMDKYNFNSDKTACLPCGDSCQDCHVALDTCSQCAFSNYGLVAGTSPQTCQPCSDNCADCSTSGAGKCDTCNAQFAFDDPLSSTRQCLPCSPSTCVSCSIAGPGKCDDCVPGYGTDSILGSPPPRCKLCEVSNCKTCYANFQYCDLCMNSEASINGQCTANAPPYVWRQNWGALFPKSYKVVQWRTTPVKYMVVHHTHNKVAKDLPDCMNMAKAMQKNQMSYYNDIHGNPMNYEDINWSHLICPDGTVLVARGFNYATRVRQGYGIRGFMFEVAFVGNFDKATPSLAAMDAFDRHVENSKPYSFDPNGKIVGDYDIRCRSCPGRALQKLIKARADHADLPSKCGPHTRGPSRSSRK